MLFENFGRDIATADAVTTGFNLLFNGLYFFRLNLGNIPGRFGRGLLEMHGFVNLRFAGALGTAHLSVQ